MQFKTTDPACMSYSNKKIKIGSGGGDFFLLLLLCLTSIPVFAQPSIQQFSPLSAAPGSAVTIQGSGFSTTPSSNQVFFGAVKGTVTSATSNVLVATVPVGATPGPIIVMVSGLSGYSKTDFQPRSGTAFPIDGGAFSIGDTIETGYYPSHALFSDLDLDGKPDMLVLRYEPNNSSPNHIMPFKNQSIPNGKVSFNPQGSFEAGIYATDLAIGDLDGDGKQDAVVTSVGNASAEIKVLRNTSTGGSISFSNVSSWTITGVANHVATGDADGDGKIDIAVSNYLDGKLMIYRNTGSAGSISFAPAVVIEAGGSADMLAFADLNGDGKRDIAVNNNLFGRIVIFNNNSSPGSISFVQTRIIELQNAPKVENIVAADLNSDGRNDLLVTTGNLTNFNGAFLVFTNNGNFTFSSPQIVQNPDFSGSYYKPSVGDLNGDGKPDVVLGWASEARFGVYQNLSEPGGTINLQFAKDWFALSPYRVAIGDLNADEQPELAIASFTSTEGVSIFDNKMGKLTISNVSPDAAEKGTEVTISGYNFSGITSVKFGNTPAASFNVVSPNTIKAIVGDGSSGRVEVSGATGTGYWEEFIYINRPKINSFSPKIGVEGDTILINGKNFSGTYEVTFGGVSATSFTVENDSTIKAIVGNGATGDIDIYTPGGSTFINGFIYPEKPYINSLDFYEGTVGDSITIFGDNLILPGMETKVTIGGVPASIFYSRDFSLGVIIGHGASGHVAVFHKGGSDSLDGFTFIPPPSNPVINSISPMSGQPGDTILVKGMNFGGLTGIYFGDSAAAYFEVVDDSTVLAVVNNGASGNVKAVAPWGFGQFPGFTFIMPSSPVLFTISPEEGITGTLIEVSGDNLYGVVSVKMGTAIITNIKYNSRKKLGFYVPLNANGPVSVTTKYGTGVLQQPLFTIWQPPKLNSFSPLTAETGETVTINGSGFGNDASSVSVYFGDIKAKILSVQPNTINVEVPGAAGLGFIKVTARNLSVFSKNKFNRSNKNTAAYPLTETLFEKFPVYQNPETSINEHKIISADFNNDGLTDYALIYKNIVRIFKNVSTRGKVEFVEGESISLYTYFSTATANDIDCDGKTDLVMVSSYEFLRNVSTPDGIKFEIIPEFFLYPSFIKDFNQDGKPDFVFKDEVGIKIVLNNSSPGNLQLPDTLNCSMPVPTSGLYQDKSFFMLWQLLGISDLDSDGLDDLVFRLMHELYLVRNTGTAAKPKFDSVITISLDRGSPTFRRLYPIKILMDDLNRDGKPDLTFMQHYFDPDFFTLKNNSTPGKINFGPLQVFTNVPFHDLQIGDFNGDDKPDLVGVYNKTLHFYQNKSTNDSIILDFAFSANGAKMVFDVADLDADGKTDIHFFNDQPMVFRNRLNENFKLSICPNSSITMQAKLESTGYQWQMNTGNGYVDITNGGIFSGVQTSNLTLTNVPSSWIKRTFRCRLNNGKFSEPYVLDFTNTWFGSQTLDWHNPNNWSCGSIPDEHTEVTVPYDKVIILNSNASCRSIIMQPYSQVRVSPGIQLTITGK